MGFSLICICPGSYVNRLTCRPGQNPLSRSAISACFREPGHSGFLNSYRLADGIGGIRPILELARCPGFRINRLTFIPGQQKLSRLQRSPEIANRDSGFWPGLNVKRLMQVPGHFPPRKLGHKSQVLSRVIGQNVCPFWLVFLCGSGRFSCSSCMGGELEVGQNVCPEWPVRPCGTTVE